MKRIAGCLAVFAACGAATAAPVAPRVVSQGGDIVLIRGEQQVRLTRSHADRDPVLSPDGRRVVFTRGSEPQDDTAESCAGDVKSGVELWSVGTDGAGAKRLAKSSAGGDPKAQLCRFANKQFSSDGGRVYFESKGWTTSGALYSYDFTSGRARFVAPSNGYFVLADCGAADYRDALVISQHRYFAFGGSFDWYWLVGADGKKEMGPVGEGLAQVDDMCGLALE